MSMTFCTLATCALFGIQAPDTVDLRLRVMGPSGPLAHIQLTADYAGGHHMLRETDEDGWATWHLDRSKGTRVQAGLCGIFRREGEDFHAYAQRLDAYLARIASYAVPPAALYELDPGVTSVERTLTIGPGVTVSAGPVTTQAGSTGDCVDLGIPGAGIMSEYDKSTGTARLKNAPANYSGFAYLSFAETKYCGRTIRIPLSTTNTDTALGPILLPAFVERTAHIRLHRVGLDREWPPRAYLATSLAGVTLVSSDGMFITDNCYYKAAQDNAMDLTTDVPPGTYFVLPGSMGPTDFQCSFIEKLAAGTDFTGSALLPHVTVAAGETKVLEYDDVDVINAIYALP